MSQDETDIQTTGANLARIKQMVVAGKPLADFEVDGQSALEYAVEKGNYELTQEILTHKPDASQIQEAFEIAADKGNIKMAQLLEEAGADINFNYQYDHDKGQRCPICYKALNLGEMEECEHLVTVSLEDGEYPVFSSTDGAVDFDYEVEELARLIRPLQEEIYNSIVARAPEDLKVLLKDVRKYSYFYWTHKEGVISFEWDVHNWHGDAGYDYFHADTGFAEKVQNEALHALGWLQDNYPELCQEPENYESEIFEFRRNERYAPKGEKETSRELADRLKRETGLTPQQLSKKLYTHISEEIGEGTPEDYMRRIEEMRAAGTLPDMEEFMQMVIRTYLDASKNN